MKPTLRDIAKEANVSVGVVSSTLNNKASERRISEETVARVRKVSQRLGYVPNHAARSLRTRRTQNLAVVVDISIQHSYLAELINCLEASARQSGYYVNVGILHNQRDAVDYLQALNSRRCDAVICVSVTLNETLDTALKALRQTGTPVVLLYCGRHDGYDCVFPDAYTSAIRSTRYLLGKRHQDIIVVGTRYEKNPRQKKYVEGVREVLEPEDVPFGPDRVYDCPAEFDVARELWAKIRSEHPGCNGVICANDDIALGLARGVRDQGLAVGEDVIIIAQNNTYPVRIASDPIPSIEYSQQLAADLVMRIVVERIETRSLLSLQESYRLEKLQPTLVERK